MEWDHNFNFLSSLIECRLRKNLSLLFKNIERDISHDLIEIESSCSFILGKTHSSLYLNVG